MIYKKTIFALMLIGMGKDFLNATELREICTNLDSCTIDMPYKKLLFLIRQNPLKLN